MVKKINNAKDLINDHIALNIEKINKNITKKLKKVKKIYIANKIYVVAYKKNFIQQ
jgi:hypothetical protein